MYFNGTKYCSIILCSLLSLSLTAKEAKTDAAKGFSKPVCFVENKGQVVDVNGHLSNDILYKLSGKGVNMYLGTNKLHYQFKKIEHAATGDPKVSTYDMEVRLVGANTHAQVVATDEQQYVENYYQAQYSTTGFTAHSFKKVTYKNVYPNIDWVLYINNDEVEYDFVVRPGGDVADIKLAYDGATALAINARGGISAETPMGNIEEQTPYAYETNTGRKVTSKFVVKNNVVSFEAGAYKGSLTIDPYLRWSTYFGGTGEDLANSVRESAAGITFVGGSTISTGLATAGVFQNTHSGAGTYDGFVASYNVAGTMIWATYFGGTGNDRGNRVALDNTAANVYLAGNSQSAATGLTQGGYQMANNGGQDGYIIKFDATNGTRVWCTFFGGTGTDDITGIVCDAGNNVCVVGQTNSTTSITAGTPYQAALDGPADAFLAKFDGAGNIQWATYYGGEDTDNGIAITADNSGNLYIVGQTASFSNMSSSFASLQGTNDAFVASFSSGGTRMWGEYFGGVGLESANGLVYDNVSNTLLVTGNTTSVLGIATAKAHQAVPGGGQDAFLVSYTNTGVINWATYIGGNLTDFGRSVCLDQFRNITVAGGSESPTGIATTTGGYQSTLAGDYDGFVVKFNTIGQRLWGTYFGGLLYDMVNSIACDLTNNQLVIAGTTASTTGIATAGSAQVANAGGTTDAFVSKFFRDTVVTINQPFDDTLVCQGGTFSVGYTVNYPFRPGNVFTVELSNASGSFVTPVTIGSAIATGSGSINATIPAATPLGNGYRMRIVANSPVYISPDDMTNVSIVSAVTPATASATTPACVGGSISLFANAPYTITSYTWNGPGGYTSAVQNPVIAGPITTSDAGTYSVTTTHPGCPAATSVVNVVVNDFTPPNPIITSNGHCVGGSLNLFGNPDTTAATITYTWSGPAGFTSTLQNPVLTGLTMANTGYYYLSDVVEGCPSLLDSIFVDVHNTTPVSVSIVVSPNDTICQGSTVLFTAITTTGGVSPTYQWRIGSTNVVGAVNSTWSVSTLSNNDVVTVILNSNLDCPAPSPTVSNAIKMTVLNNSPIVSITASAGPSVTAGSPVTFTALTFNGGVGAIYQWMRNGVIVPGADSATYTIPSVTTADTVMVIVTSTMACAIPNFAMSNTMIVHAHTVGVNTTATTFDAMELFPNPNAGNFTLRGELLSSSDATIDVVNALGQTVYTEQMTAPAKQVNKTISLGNVAAGVYMVRLTQDGVTKIMRCAVQH